MIDFIMNTGPSIDWLNDNKALYCLMAGIICFVTNLLLALFIEKHDGPGHSGMLAPMPPITILLSFMVVGLPLFVLLCISFVAIIAFTFIKCFKYLSSLSK